MTSHNYESVDGSAGYYIAQVAALRLRASHVLIKDHLTTLQRLPLDGSCLCPQGLRFDMAACRDWFIKSVFSGHNVRVYLLTGPAAASCTATTAWFLNNVY